MRCACEACARVWVSVLVCCVRARVRVRVQRPPVAIVDLAFFMHLHFHTIKAQHELR